LVADDGRLNQSVDRNDSGFSILLDER